MILKKLLCDEIKLWPLILLKVCSDFYKHQTSISVSVQVTKFVKIVNLFRKFNPLSRQWVFYFVYVKFKLREYLKKGC